MKVPKAINDNFQVEAKELTYRVTRNGQSVYIGCGMIKVPAGKIKAAYYYYPMVIKEVEVGTMYKLYKMATLSVYDEEIGKIEAWIMIKKFLTKILTNKKVSDFIFGLSDEEPRWCSSDIHYNDIMTFQAYRQIIREIVELYE